MSNGEKIYLDQKGYNMLLAELENLKQELADNYLEKGEAYSGSVGDGWHDNFAFEEANRQERMILGKIRDCQERLSKAVIIEKTGDNELIDLGDIININMIFDVDDIETCLIQLVSISDNKFDDGIQKVSVNSPLGQAIYHKHVGDKTTYEVNKRNINIEILSKENEENLYRKRTRR